MHISILHAVRHPVTPIQITFTQVLFSQEMLLAGRREIAFLIKATDQDCV